jgi:cell division septum initiation protein DivIVA
MESALEVLDRLERVLRRHLERLPSEQRGPLEQEVYGLLKMARGALPKELHHAQWLLQEAEGALARAREEARRLILDAQTHARSLTSAQRPGERPSAPAEFDDARREADRVRRGADEYAAQVLQRLEVEVERVLAAIHRGQQVLKTQGAHSVPGAQGAPSTHGAPAHGAPGVTRRRDG